MCNLLHDQHVHDDVAGDEVDDRGIVVKSFDHLNEDEERKTGKRIYEVMIQLGTVVTPHSTCTFNIG